MQQSNSPANVFRGPRLVRGFCHWLGALAVATLMAAMLLCWAPGVGIDEAEFDAGRTSEAVAVLRLARAGDGSVLQVLTQLGRGLATGELGHSPVFNRPVASLLAERAPVTAALVVAGLALAWCTGLALAVCGLRGPRLRLLPLAFTTLLVSIPAAVVALGCALAGWPAAVAMAAAVLPKVYSFSDQILQRASAEPHRLMALARGLGPLRVLTAHVLWPAWPELRALAGVTIPLALGAAIPVEVFTDTPGLGQLAWKAASGRDVMLLLYLTIMLTGFTLLLGRDDGQREAAHA